MLLVETIFDTANARAALFAIQSLFESHPELAVPIMVCHVLSDTECCIIHVHCSVQYIAQLECYTETHTPIRDNSLCLLLPLPFDRRMFV